MKRIGILSDTHGTLDERVFSFFKDCDEVWHAGDIGSEEVLDKLEGFKPLRIVYGNIDSHKLRARVPRELIFQCEKVKVYLTHIGGYPKKYDSVAYAALKRCRPKLFVCGHSHILKVMFDKELNLLHVNPGAAGNFGFHQKRTMIRMVIDGENMKDLEVIEID
jgi:putative phosphoesterase